MEEGDLTVDQEQSGMHCSQCGAANENLTGLGPTYWLSQFSSEHLEEFFRGRWDDFPCTECHSPTGVRPTVCFLCIDPASCTIAVGSLAEGEPLAMLEMVRQKVSDVDEDIPTKVLPNLNALRHHVQDQLREDIEVLGAAIGDVTSMANLSFINFAAALAVERCPEVGLQLKVADDSGNVLSPLQRLDAIAQLQANAWIALLAESGKKSSDRNLDTDLAAHFHEGVLIPGAADVALAALDKLESIKNTPAGNYRRQAVRASICDLAGIENEHEESWAIALFELELNARLGGPNTRDLVAPLILSSELLRKTISFANSVAAGQRMLVRDQSRRVMDALEDLSIKLGYPELLSELQNSMRLDVSGPRSVVDILLSMREIASQTPDLFVAAHEHLSSNLVRTRDLAGLEQLADQAIKLVDGVPAMRAAIEASLGRNFKVLRAPVRFLKRLGRTPQPWELELGWEPRAILWTERSNALRLLGLPSEALVLAEEILALLPPSCSPSMRRTARLNRAILKRETGAPDASVFELEDILPGSVGSGRLEILTALAVGYQVLNKSNAAMRCHREALSLARGPLAKEVPQLKAKLAIGLIAESLYSEAIELLIESGRSDPPDPVHVLALGSAWATLIANDVPLPSKVRQPVVGMLKDLATVINQSAAQGDTQALLDSMRLRAILCERFSPDSAELIWQSVLDACEQAGVSPSAYELLALARFAYEAGDHGRGYELLLRVPESLFSTAGQATQIAPLAETLERRHRRQLDQLSEVVVQAGSFFADVRLVSEMRRDLVGRSQRLSRSDIHPEELAVLQEGLSEDLLGQLAQPSGQLCVVEWVGGRGWMSCVATVINSDGNVQSKVLSIADIDLAKVAARIQARLSSWSPGREGEPFAFPAWQALEAWLLESLDPLVDDGGHIVFLEHEEYAGIPWHVAARSRWTTSYASGWVNLIRLLSADPPKRPIARLAECVVPRFHESAMVLAAMNASAMRTREMAKRIGIHLEAKSGTECDRDALRTMLGDADVTKVICHGYVSREQHDVAFMLAASGSLPLAHSVAAGSTMGKRHRFGWSECRGLAKSSRLILSAACSSGHAHVVGLGERVGLISALRDSGTMAIVAPRWDVVAEDILPIMDDALERYLMGASLAVAARRACESAQMHVPNWLAWALCVEGDWR